MHFPILSSLVALPLVGAVLLLVMADDDRQVRKVALAVSVLVFAETLLLWLRFAPGSADFQFVERHEWIPAFGVHYAVGVDGISLMLLVLTGFLTPLALLGSWESVHEKTRAFCISVLLLESAMIGVFISIDLFLFYVFWDAMLIPMYFLIGIWGYERRVYAAVKFILYTMAGSVLMLLAILGLAYLHSTTAGNYSFDLLDLYALKVPSNLQFWFFLAFAVAFAIKVPLFPFHTWLPDAHVEAPTAGSVILAGVLLKMGTYGLVRFAFPLFPDAATFFAPYLGALAVIGIVYGALVAMVQPDMKKLVAYSSVSHLGFVVLGIAAMNTQGVEGAVYQMLNHGVSTGGLFLIVGMLSDRRHTRLIAEYRRAQEGDAASGRGVPDCDALVHRASRAQRVRRRIPDPARRVPRGRTTGRHRRDRRHSVGDLHALDVPAGELRAGDEREECAAARSSTARVGGHRADHCGSGHHGRVPEPVPPADRAGGRAHADAGATRIVRGAGPPDTPS